MKLKIALEENKSGYCRRVCYSCGAWFRLGEVAINLCDDEGNSAEICDDCLRAGPNEGMRGRVRQRAKNLKEVVTSLEEIAEAPSIDAPTFEAYEKRVKEEEKKYLESLSLKDRVCI